MSILRMFKKDPQADPAMLAKQADEATAIHSITVPKYRVKGNFVEYVIECSRISTTWQVYRRYQQFKSLDQQLKALCPMGSPNHCEFGVVPVLCATHWTEVTNQSPELVERRRRYLEIYLQQLLCPKNLFYAAKTALHNFLHDGEVPILHKSRINRPLPGFGMLPPSGGYDNARTGFKPDDEEREEAHKQVVAVLSKNEKENVHSAALPDLTKNKAVVSSPTAVSANASAANRHADPTAAAADEAEAGGEDHHHERCARCGYEAIIDYDIEEWVSEGRCPKCKDHSTFVLIAPASASASATSPTATSKAAATAAEAEATNSGSTAKSPSSSSAAAGGSLSLKGPDGDEIACDSDSSSDDGGGLDGGLDMDDERRASIGFACSSCRRVFDINLVPRRCYLCTNNFCRNCSRKALRCDVDKAVGGGCGGGGGGTDWPPTSPSRTSCLAAASSSGGNNNNNTNNNNKRVRMCDRCFTNYERHTSSPTGSRGSAGGQSSSGTAANTSLPISATGEALQVPPSNTHLLATSPQHNPVSLLGGSSSSSTVGSGGGPASASAKPAALSLAPSVATSAAAASTAVCASPSSPAPLAPPMPRTKDIALSDFQLVTTLGRGTFGKVLKVRYLPTGEMFAMKVLNKSVIHKRRMVDYIREEKNIMAYLPPHPFVCTCHYSFQTEYHVFFVLDYLCGGELYTHIYPNRTITEADARIYIAEIILGVEHMHRHDICHRDLKPENIVLDRDGHLKITDFGLARMNFSRVRRRSFVGSAEYLAPETIQGDTQTRALDWWSVGVMLYELLCGVAPFHASTNNEVYQAVLNKKLDFASHRESFSPTAQNLITRMLEKDIRLRLVEPDKIKAHPFFDGLDWAKLAQRQVTPPFTPNLNDNDTKYFNRDFTSEWATIRNPQGVGRQTAEMLTRRFSNFRVVPEHRKGPMPQLTANKSALVVASAEDASGAGAGAGAGPDSGSSAAFSGGAFTSSPSCGGLEGGMAAPSLSLVNPQSFVGVWRLVTVELTTSNGQTCYPWGSEAIGILKYTENGLYALQLCPMKRLKFKNTSADKITRDELADAYLSYVGSFGTYEVLPGKSYITQTPTGALCPNSVGVPEKWYFDLMSEDRLRLMTTPMAAEEGMVARTVVTWERVSK